MVNITEDEMNNNILTVLQMIITRNGIKILDDSERFRSFLDDLAPNEPKKERTTLIKCLQYDFHSELQKHPNDDDRLRRKQQLAERLYDEEGIAHDLCNNALDLLEMVYFGKTTERKLSKNIPMQTNYIRRNIMVNFDEMYACLEKHGPGKAISSRGTEYRVEAKNDKILAFPKSGRITIHKDCWGQQLTCQKTRAGGIYNGPYSIYDWYEENK
jgi:hypothetical protein